MKHLLIIVLSLYICSCSKPVAFEPVPCPSPAPVPTAEINAAVNEYLKTGHFVMAVHGVTLHRQTDDYYVAAADYDTPDGKRDIYQLIVRRYTGDKGSYWRAEELSMRLVDTLNGKDDDKK